jgi:SAM-dependent methyltransferase
MATAAISTSTRFQLALPVADLPSSLSFYRLLLNGPPVNVTPASATFATDNPPLDLTLLRGPSAPGTLNHLGLRIAEQSALVALQRRLEEAGIATQRQEGVECCYALQTKFWVTDPDKNLWELYILHEDLDHSGFDDHALQHKSARAPKVWTLTLTEPIPAQLDFADGSLDEVNLEGTFNAPLDNAVKTRLLAEVRRVLRPGGTIAIHGMCGDRPFPGSPAFPGIASLVKHVPTQDEISQDLLRAGFVNLILETFDGICLSVPGMELREIRLIGMRPSDEATAGSVLYRGPFDEVVDDAGTRFRRGERVAVSARTLSNLRQSADVNQFVFFSELMRNGQP